MLHQALRVQRPGARADDHQRRGPRARPARDPPRRLRSRRTGGRRLVRHDRLQQGQRRLLRGAARPHRWDPARRMGLRRARHVGLVRHALHCARRTGGARPGDAGALGLARPDAGGSRPPGPGRRIGGRRAGPPPAAPDGTGRAARRHGTGAGGRAGGGRPRAPGGGPPGRRRRDCPAGQRRPAAPADGPRPRRRPRTQRRPAGDGRRQLGGHAAPAPERGRRAWPSASPTPRSPPRSDAGSTGDCPPSTCG